MNRVLAARSIHAALGLLVKNRHNAHRPLTGGFERNRPDCIKYGPLWFITWHLRIATVSLASTLESWVNECAADG
jgi:hypothetical protein